MKLRTVGTLMALTIATAFTLLLVTLNEVTYVETAQKETLKKIGTPDLAQFGEINRSEVNGDITGSDVQIAAWKTQMAVDVADKFWRGQFSSSGRRYQQPRVVTFYNVTSSACGPVQDAAYCRLDHSIYLNLYFLARVMRSVGSRLGSDGDMAIVTIVAHEWGHSVQAQTVGLNPISKVNELNADCQAGAFTLFSYQNGMLETGDFEEAFNALAAGGDNAPWFAPNAHGSADERIASFKGGFNGGVRYCGVL